MKLTVYVCDECGKHIDPIGEGLGTPRDAVHFCSSWCRELWQVRQDEDPVLNDWPKA